MYGTLINCAAVIAGALIGLIFKKSIRPSWQTSLNKALGAAVAVIGINGVISSMFTVGEGGTLLSSGELLLTVSLVIGTLLGEILKIESGIETLSLRLEQKLAFGGFTRGFVSASTLFCVGAMAIVGALNNGLTGDISVLGIKSVLDFTAAVILASTLGAGVLFAFVPLLIYQGLITLFAGALASLLSGEMLQQICMVGYTVIICIGINFIADTKIKTANMLPSLLVPVAWHYLQVLFSALC